MGGNASLVLLYFFSGSQRAIPGSREYFLGGREDFTGTMEDFTGTREDFLGSRERFLVSEIISWAKGVFPARFRTQPYMP